MRSKMEQVLEQWESAILDAQRHVTKISNFQEAMSGDQHQKVHRIRSGDVIAVPAGAVHWCYNDGNEELIAVSVLDLNSNANQLDQNLRVIFLSIFIRSSSSF